MVWTVATENGGVIPLTVALLWQALQVSPSPADVMTEA
jgi:hypothetical protein